MIYNEQEYYEKIDEIVERLKLDIYNDFLPETDDISFQEVGQLVTSLASIMESLATVITDIPDLIDDKVFEEKVRELIDIQLKNVCRIVATRGKENASKRDL